MKEQPVKYEVDWARNLSEPKINQVTIAFRVKEFKMSKVSKFKFQKKDKNMVSRDRSGVSEEK